MVLKSGKLNSPCYDIHLSELIIEKAVIEADQVNVILNPIVRKYTYFLFVN